MPVKIFFCYAHEDEALLNKLKSHLRPLQRQGLIDVWYDRDISAGTEWGLEIRNRLDDAQIILLLVSPDFMNSDYCYGIEMQRAIERHKRGEARVIPIILRPVYWNVDPLGSLQALPKDAKPVTDPDWHNLDRAFFNVTEGIRKAIEKIPARPSPLQPAPKERTPLPKQAESPAQRSAPKQTSEMTRPTPLKQEQPAIQKQELLSSTEKPLKREKRNPYPFSILIGGGLGVLSSGLSWLIFVIHFSPVVELILSTVILVVAGSIAGFRVGRNFGTTIGGLLACAIVGILFVIGVIVEGSNFGLPNYSVIVSIIGALFCVWFGASMATVGSRRYRWSRPII